MALVRHTHEPGSALTPEQLARINEAAKHLITYDKDCPKLTQGQLSEFQPVNYATWEERAAAMRAAGIVSPNESPDAQPLRVVEGDEKNGFTYGAVRA
jgi:hypothetical protein